MGSVFTHAMLAGVLGGGMLPRGLRARVLALGVLGAILPDIDILAFQFDLPEGHPLGHRGFTHSLAFAALYAALMAAVALPDWVGSRYRRRCLVFLFVATASHGLLDALTDGRRGIAFLSPLSNLRFYSPWQPLPAAPIDVGRFFSAYGIEVIRQEIFWIWLPAVALSATIYGLRRRLRAAAPPTGGDGRSE